MLTLDQCLKANRPLIFVVAESDLEVLKYINDNYKKHKYFVYSSTLYSTPSLASVLQDKFRCTINDRKEGTIDVLNRILAHEFEQRNNRFNTFVFLDCDTFINDSQNIRRIKDIVTRYTVDTDFAVNLIFVSNQVCVPSKLERMAEVVYFDLPPESALKEKTEYVAQKLSLKKKGKMPSEDVVTDLKGLTLFEAEQALLQSFALYQEIRVDFIRDFKKNSLAKTNLLSVLESDVTFDDIGGMETLKEWVRKSAGGWTPEGRKFGLPILKGLLLVGLPGCGKSLIAKSMGNEWGLPVIQFDPSRIFSSRVGDSEANIRRVFQIIENISPCILFLDEAEKGFAGMQSSTFSDAGVTARVIGSFLVWMQECEKPVFTVATSNNIQYLPPELISRFDESFFVNMPLFSERVEIFKIHLKKMGRKPEAFDIEALATGSKDLSGREIEQVLKEAMYDAFHSGSKDITTDIIKNALDRKTSIIRTMAEQLKYLIDWVGWDEDKQDGIRARYANPTGKNEVDRVNAEIENMLKDIEGGKDVN